MGIRLSFSLFYDACCRKKPLSVAYCQKAWAQTEGAFFCEGAFGPRGQQAGKFSPQQKAERIRVTVRWSSRCSRWKCLEQWPGSSVFCCLRPITNPAVFPAQLGAVLPLQGNHCYSCEGKTWPMINSWTSRQENEDRTRRKQHRYQSSKIRIMQRFKRIFSQKSTKIQTSKCFELFHFYISLELLTFQQQDGKNTFLSATVS